MRNLRSWKLFAAVPLVGLLAAACGGGSVGGGDEAEAADFPSKNITLVVPWSAGGGTDIVGRALAQAMSDVSGVDVIVENREGAGSAIGSGYVQKSDPDGYTLLFNTSSVISQTYVAQEEGADTLDYTQLVPVANVNSDPYTMQVNPNSEWSTLAEFIEYAKAHPGEVSIGVAGAGSQSQLLIPLIESEAGIQLNQVSFDGSGPINTALMAGDVEAHAPTIGDFLSFIRDGEIKLIGVAAAERLEEFPDVPTFRESGLDIEYRVFRGVWAPKGTPDEVLAKIEEIVLEAAASEEFQKTLADLGYGPASWDREEFQGIVDQEAELLKRLMQEEGLIS
jgi:tripartite-type tricarboxylate transporter receptor subunit TctC